MAKLHSSWSSPVEPMPENYIFPVDSRPGDAIIPFCETLPLIDLRASLVGSRHNAIQQVLEACQQFGIFQLINHGVEISDTMKVVKEFFDMSDEEKAELYSEDQNRKCRFFHSGFDYKKEKVHLWRDSLRHQCRPLDECIPFWPEKPARYRHVVGKYSVEMGKLLSTILDLLSEGLGLGSGYFREELVGDQSFSALYYPPCPDPTLTLGFPTHCDLSLISIIHQDETYGLQIHRDGKWMGVRPIADALVVILGLPAQVISNNRLTIPPHRSITNSTNARTSIITPIFPKLNSIVEPAKAMLNDSNQPLYRPFEFKEFRKSYLSKKDFSERVLDDFKVNT